MSVRTELELLGDLHRRFILDLLDVSFDITDAFRIAFDHALEVFDALFCIACSLGGIVIAYALEESLVLLYERIIHSQAGPVHVAVEDGLGILAYSRGEALCPCFDDAFPGARIGLVYPGAVFEKRKRTAPLLAVKGSLRIF